jgi:hypothetical protein
MNRPAAEKDPPHVHRHRQIPFVVGDVEPGSEGRLLEEGGIVHEDVQATEVIEDVAGHRLGRGPI